MSVWTTIHAVIKIKNISPSELVGEFKTVDFDEDDDAVWENCNVPKGTEGSLGVEINQCGDDCIVWFIGNLRGFGDECPKHVMILDDWWQGLNNKYELKYASMRYAMGNLETVVWE